MIVDLHCHSTNSDGTWSVEQILKEAEKRKINVLSITDHDNFKGSLEANEFKNLFSGNLIIGIEISTLVNDNKIHLLAYFPHFPKLENNLLLESLYKIQNSRVTRMKIMIANANSLGFNVTFNEVLKEAGTGVTGDKQPTDILSRPHLARVLIRKGYVNSFEEAFDNYLADGKSIHAERFTLTFEEWIKQFQQNKGLIVWAHPLHGHKEKKENLINIGHILSESAIDGVERFYNYKGKYRVSDEFELWGNSYLDELINKKNWLTTAGGDFHGNIGKLGETHLDKEKLDAFLEKLYS